MPHVLWNLDVHKSGTILRPEPDKSIHTLTLFFFFSINFNMILPFMPKFPNALMNICLFFGVCIFLTILDRLIKEALWTSNSPQPTL